MGGAHGGGLGRVGFPAGGLPWRRSGVAGGLRAHWPWCIQYRAGDVQRGGALAWHAAGHCHCHGDHARLRGPAQRPGADRFRGAREQLAGSLRRRGWPAGAGGTFGKDREAMSKQVDTVIFDLGNVLIGWDPRRLYRQLIDDEAQMEWFLRDVCNSEWNEQQDAGRPWAEATALLRARFPEHADLIDAYHQRWEETLV